MRVQKRVFMKATIAVQNKANTRKLYVKYFSNQRLQIGLALTAVKHLNASFFTCHDIAVDFLWREKKVRFVSSNLERNLRDITKHGLEAT